ERRERDARFAQQGKVLGVRVGVADEEIEDDPAQQPQGIRRGGCTRLTDERKTAREIRTAFGFVLLFGRYAERLTEVFLLQAAHVAVIANAIVTRDLIDGDVEIETRGVRHVETELR